MGVITKFKKHLLLFILVTMVLTICACKSADNQAKQNGKQTNESEKTSDRPSPTVTAVKPQKIVATKVQKEAANYVPISKVGTYNKQIITDDLLKNCTLPLATKEKLPYWTGFNLENKISVNQSDDAWKLYTAGMNYFTENELKYFHENGFNCARVLYSMSFFSKPGDDINMINESELDQLDELISWGLKYNIHIMISITGMPGKWNTSWEEEGVQSSGQIFTDKKMQKAFGSYWDMLAKRYAGIPANVLSFELLAEPQEDNNDLAHYSNVLAPVAKDIWKYNDKRIVIANDLSKVIPEQLAAIGCCLSLHTHIYTVDSNRLGDRGIGYTATWPMQYFSGYVNENSGQMTLVSDSGLKKGKITIYYENCSTAAKISADDKVIYKPVRDKSQESTTAAFPESTKKLVIKPQADASILAVCIEQDGKDKITIPTHSLYGVPIDNEPLPTIKVNDDGSLVNIDKPQKVLDSTYFTNAYLKGFIDCAKKHKVSFLMTEVGTDTLDLTPEEYVAYHSEWLKSLKENHIPWMYNCVHNILAPDRLMYLNNSRSLFTDFSDEKDLGQYKVNNTVMNMLKSFE